jgi:hypothetical protein
MDALSDVQYLPAVSYEEEHQHYREVVQVSLLTCYASHSDDSSHVANRSAHFITSRHSAITINGRSWNSKGAAVICKR